MSVHDMLFQPKASFPSNIWQQSLLKWMEVPGTFWKNTTILSHCSESCGWRKELCLKQLTLEKKEKLSLVYEHLHLG